jgi:hypothetical protein
MIILYLGSIQFISMENKLMECCVKAIFCTRNVLGVEIAKCITTERCTRQLALTAEKNVMFLSSQTVQGQFIAVSATQKDDHQEDIKLIS